MRSALAVGLILGAMGCHEPTAVACTQEARPALSVTVRDVTTGGDAGASVVIARDGAYADTADAGVLGMIYSLAWERPGTYDVQVLNSAYLPWEQTGVLVTADQCHVRTVAIDARLIPKA